MRERHGEAVLVSDQALGVRSVRDIELNKITDDEFRRLDFPDAIGIPVTINWERAHKYLWPVPTNEEGYEWVVMINRRKTKS